MDIKKSLFLFAISFPVTFVIGVIVSFVYSLQFHDHVQIDWIVVFSVAVLLAFGITWRHNRDEKRRKAEL